MVHMAMWTRLCRSQLFPLVMLLWLRPRCLNSLCVVSAGSRRYTRKYVVTDVFTRIFISPPIIVVPAGRRQEEVPKSQFTTFQPQNVAVAAVALPSLSRSNLSALKSGCGCGGVGSQLSQAEPTEKAESSVPVKGRNCVRNFLVPNFYLHWPGGMEKRLQLKIQLQ